MIIHNVAQGSDAWFAKRAGLPTASKASMLITSTGKASTQITDYSYQLAAELYAGKPLDAWAGNEHTERGTLLEDPARLEYERISGNWVEQVGFCTNDEGLYGCSPDGMVENGMVELKCPTGKNFVKNAVYYANKKNPMPEYIPQIQMQMLVCKNEVDWCDLAFYHPDLPMLIIRQEKIPAIQEMLIKQLAVCIELRDNALKVIEGTNEA